MNAYRLVLELLVITLVVIVPLSVHAGVFSMFFDTAKAEVTSPIMYEHDTNVQDMPLLRAAINIDPNPAKGGGDVLVEDGALVSARDIDRKDETVNTKTSNGEISLYIVREADTLSQIAEMFSVSAKTILWANNISDPSTIHPGDELLILPISGVQHIAKKGDTLKSIAKKYFPDPEMTNNDIQSVIDDIIAFNQLTGAEDISVGDTIVVPNGTMSVPARSTSPSRVSGGSALATGGGSASFSNPLPGSVKTQGIHGYNGVDLSGVAVGTPVLAAAGGEVIVAKSSGWNG